MKRQEQPRSGGIHNYFYGPVGQFIDYGSHNQFGQQWEDKTVANGAEHIQDRLLPDLPSKESMCQAVAAAVRDGLWYGNQAWAVVYRIYQLKGYLGGMSEFVREVKTWPTELAATCTYDAVQKPVAKGKMIGHIQRWAANGAPQETVALAEALAATTDKLTIKEE